MKRSIMIIALTLIATAASAQQGNRGPMHRPEGPRGGGEMGRAIVGSDGVVYITSVASSSSGGTATMTATVKAIRSTGTTAWTATLPGGAREVTLSGNVLITVTSSQGDSAATSTLTAISTNSGGTVWTRTLSGRVTDLAPFSGGTYAFTSTPSATSGSAPTRNLVAVSSDGSVLWTVAL